LSIPGLHYLNGVISLTYLIASLGCTEIVRLRSELVSLFSRNPCGVTLGWCVPNRALY
jgi:hypothetical protein